MNLRDFLNPTMSLDKFNYCLNNSQSCSISGVGVGERVCLISDIKKPILYIALNRQNLDRIARQFRYFGKRVEIVDRVQQPNYSLVDNSQNFVQLYNALCHKLAGEIDVLIIVSEVCLSPLPSREFFRNFLQICVGQKLELHPFIAQCIDNGYRRVDIVNDAGDFSIKGDVIDIKVQGSNEIIEYKISLFGDVVEKIIEINQKNSKEIKAINIFPICLNYNTLKDIDYGELSNCAMAFDDGQRGFDKYILFRYMENNPQSIIDYFANDVVVVEEVGVIKEQLKAQVIQHENILNNFPNDLRIKDYKFFLDSFDFSDIKQCVFVDNINTFNEILKQQAIPFKTSQLFDFTKFTSGLIDEVKYYLSQDFTIIFSAQSEGRVARLETILKNNFLKYSKEKIEKQSINIINDDIPLNICLINEKLVVYSEGVRTDTKQQAKKNLYLPKIGEYVVHNSYGIGKCKSAEKLNFGICEKDYFVIEYDSGNILYLPTENADEIREYIGSPNPKLNKLGTDQFAKMKQSVRSSIKELAFDLCGLYADRKKQKGCKYPSDDEIMQQFEEDFPYELTPDQASAITESKNDMESGKVMDRLICGDVGFGKTEVALRVAMKTILSGKQVVFLAPTTILCLQHFNNCKARMNKFGIEVALVSRLTNASGIASIKQGLKSGKIDIVCATHKILRGDYNFYDLGLLILDEEQRFGVADKEKIKLMKTDLNVLTMSATPIPRTLQLSLIGVRDISLISTPPTNRVEVQTIVDVYSEQLLVSACEREIQRGGQVLVLYNSVERIESFCSKLRLLLGEGVNVDYAHGQMNPKELEAKILKVYNRQTSIFVATTLIENGIDLPSANTLFVVNADRLGLSQLYQLRGRVGRSGEIAFAYFTYFNLLSISEIAYERLVALKEFSKLGSGYRIAMRDLQLRGAGDILGADQHGHINKIGYDMYCRILEDVVKNTNSEKTNAKIEIEWDAFLDKSYVENESDRINIYNEIANLNRKVEYEKLATKLGLVYGKIPYQVTNLMRVGLMKNICNNCQIERLIIRKNQCYAEFATKISIGVRLLVESKFSNALIESSNNGKDKVIFEKNGTISQKVQTICSFLEKVLKL